MHVKFLKDLLQISSVLDFSNSIYKLSKSILNEYCESSKWKASHVINSVFEHQDRSLLWDASEVLKHFFIVSVESPKSIMCLDIGSKGDLLKEVGLKGDLYEDSAVAWHIGFGKLMKAIRTGAKKV